MIARPVWSGPREKKKVACAWWLCSVSTRRGTPSRVPRSVKACKFEKPDEFKLHSFRHHFASLCANHGVAHRKALAWLGHSSSDMLDLYYHLHDDDSQQAMQALAATGTETAVVGPAAVEGSEGSLMANGQSTIEKLSQVREFQELVDCLTKETERGGFEPPVQVEARTTV